MVEAREVFYLAKKISHTFFHVINDCIRDTDLTKSQWDVIRYLIQRRKENADRVTQRDIERFFSVSNPTISGILDRLEKKGLIERSLCEHDKRVHHISPTREAFVLYERVIDDINHQEEKLLSTFSQTQLEEGVAFLEQILSNLIEMKGESYVKDPGWSN